MENYNFILNYCKNLFYTHKNFKFAALYNDESNEFELYCHPFSWNKGTHNMLQYVALRFKTVCCDNPGHKVSLGDGGHCPDSGTRKLKTSDTVARLPKEFIQHSQTSKNNCVWLSIVLLLGWNNKELDEMMIKMMTIEPERYEWMFLTKIPKRFKELSFLSSLLSPNTLYLLKISKQTLSFWLTT